MEIYGHLKLASQAQPLFKFKFKYLNTVVDLKKSDSSLDRIL